MISSVSRETIFANLLTLLKTVQLSQPFPSTWAMAGRKLLLWDDVPSGNQPALFLHQGTQTVTQQTFPLNQWNLKAQIWVYFRADGSDSQSTPPDTLVNLILDAIDSTLTPTPGLDYQTLYGTVYHCMISGQVAFDSGLVDGQGVIVIPIEILP
jgi:hypothetical protein